MFRDGEASHELLAGEDFWSVDQFLEWRGVTAGGFAGDAGFLFERGVVDFDEEHETVELSFGQRVSAFLFDWVLSGENEKWRGQRVGLAEDRDLVFLHRFEHGRLRFGGRAVDFIGEHHVGKDRAFDELEFPAAACAGFLDDVGAGDVGGHQVGGELDAVEGEVEGLRDRGNEQGFGEAGYAHQQRVAFGKEADRELFDDLFLADDHLANFSAQDFVDFSKFVDGGDIVFGKLWGEGGVGFHDWGRMPS